MAIPNAEKRCRALQSKNIEKSNRKDYLGCKRQFPECPQEINEKDCKMCPHYKKQK